MSAKAEQNAPIDNFMMLYFQYRAAAVPLERVIADYMPGMSMVEAKRRALSHTLPFDCFRASTKAGWMVKVSEIAKWLNQV